MITKVEIYEIGSAIEDSAIESSFDTVECAENGSVVRPKSGTTKSFLENAGAKLVLTLN